LARQKSNTGVVEEESKPAKQSSRHVEKGEDDEEESKPAKKSPRGGKKGEDDEEESKAPKKLARHGSKIEPDKDEKKPAKKSARNAEKGEDWDDEQKPSKRQPKPDPIRPPRRGAKSESDEERKPSPKPLKRGKTVQFGSAFAEPKKTGKSKAEPQPEPDPEADVESGLRFARRRRTDVDPEMNRSLTVGKDAEPGPKRRGKREPDVAPEREALKRSKSKVLSESDSEITFLGRPLGAPETSPPASESEEGGTPAWLLTSMFVALSKSTRTPASSALQPEEGE
jgi:hypothetical protein